MKIGKRLVNHAQRKLLCVSTQAKVRDKLSRFSPDAMDDFRARLLLYIISMSDEEFAEATR